ncbi:hypothetical protein CVT26_010651 [Gymnopilus dilepis]|uniref:Aldose 1-epimerase n=1 Tax=Gymnopilus dilepis TaxID=231916 RepID=A0A409VIB0_9AGAR|nr:hypothetical protein CVT26_010651 [Gymnopilus dilepis]
MALQYLLCALLTVVALLLPAHAETTAITPVQLVAPDGSMRAAFIPFGAITTNIWVKDKHGVFRDIILGFDNHSLYQSDAEGHPYFGPIVGRSESYANRIRDGTFTIPISKDASGPGKKFVVPHNEGNNTLHGGPDGFDRRLWTTVKQTSNSVTFSLTDPAGMEGFPGTVETQVTYTLERKSTWKIKSQDLDAHFAQFESSRFVATDGALIPTGKLNAVSGTPLDFRKAKSIGESIPATAAGQFCGTGCVGFDNCWILDSPSVKKPTFSIWSKNSGIKLDIFTNQIAFQVYSCNGIFNASLPIPRKASQGGPGAIYTDHSCVVIEPESLIDAINNPEFGVNQIFGPERPYDWESTYVFSTVH